MNKNKEIVCPECGSDSVRVSSETVENLLKEDFLKDAHEEFYYACTGEECHVVYFDEYNSLKFEEKDLKVPVWFKNDADPKYACYCSRVTVDDVRDAVLNRGAKTVEDVNMITGAMRFSICKKKNPLGRCCYNTIKAIIDDCKI